MSDSLYDIPPGCICMGDGLFGMKCEAAEHATTKVSDPRLAPALTPKQRRALEILAEGPLLPSRFYAKMWPLGRYVNRDPGSSKGGPSRSEYAANNFLGKLDAAGLVFRLSYHGGDGKWRITPEGREVLKGAL